MCCDYAYSMSASVMINPLLDDDGLLRAVDGVAIIEVRSIPSDTGVVLLEIVLDCTAAATAN